MSYLIAAPDMLAAAADAAGIGSSLSEAYAAAMAPTTRVIAAAEDEVSAAIAALFSRHGKAFQAISAQAAAFHSQFVQALNAGAGTYASAEAANAGTLQTLAQDMLNVVHAPTLALLGRPLIGNGGMGGAAGLFGAGGPLGLRAAAEMIFRRSQVPNMAVSVGGHTLEFGSATANSGPGPSRSPSAPKSRRQRHRRHL